MRDRVHIFSSFFHQRLMDSTRDMTGCKDLRYIHVRERERLTKLTWTVTNNLNMLSGSGNSSACGGKSGKLGLLIVFNCTHNLLGDEKRERFVVICLQFC